jgi:hypothetical protein
MTSASSPGRQPGTSVAPLSSSRRPGLHAAGHAGLAGGLLTASQGDRPPRAR